MREGKKRKLFEEVIEPYYQNVYNFIVSKTNDSELAQDLTQNTFEKAWFKLEQLKEKEAALKWIFSIAQNEIRIYFRAQGTQKRSLFEEESFEEFEGDVASLEHDVLDVIIARESKEDAMEAFRGVKEEYRDVLWLRIMEEMSYAEIAEVLVMKEATARTKYRRGLIYLKAAYEKVTGGENHERRA